MSSISSVGGFIQSKFQASFKRSKKNINEVDENGGAAVGGSSAAAAAAASHASTHANTAAATQKQLPSHAPVKYIRLLYIA
jgi:hypothetical protein